MSRYLLEVMYDGTAFHGSQLQGALPTVQGALNMALSTLLRTSVITFGASRTDEGVHAGSNFYHFDAKNGLPEHFSYQLNSLLPPSVAIKNIFYCADENFNARFDAVSRSYRYRLYARKNPFLVNRALFYPFEIDKAVLAHTASIIKEHQDFESFSKRNTQTRTFNCNIYDSYWEEKEGQLHYVVKANRFLRGMVRGLVATQLYAGRGKISTDNFINILESKNCTRAFFNVAGYGLYLESITYPEGVLQLMNLQ